MCSAMTTELWENTTNKFYPNGGEELKENIIKAGICTAGTALSIYMGEMIVPLCILMAVMIADYISGMAKAYVHKRISSRTGIVGIVKKIMYLFSVAVGMTADWLITQAINDMGGEYSGSFAVGLLIISWLIINELISILENVAEIGVPLPQFLKKLLIRLKAVSEKKMNQIGDTENGDDDDNGAEGR